MDLAGILGLDGSNPSLLLYMILPLGMVMLVFVFFGGRGSRKNFTRRIARIKVNHDPEPTVGEILIARRKVNSSAVPGLDELLKKLMPRQDVLRLRLSRAGLNIAISVFVLAGVLVAAMTFVGAQMFAGTSVAISFLLAIVAGLGLPHFFVGFLIKRRQTRFIDFFPEAVDLMVRGIKAGLPIGESIRTASEEVPNPVGEELARITDGIRIGRKLEEVLWETSLRLDLQEFKFFTIALSIQAETGGNLAETLTNLSDVLRSRRQLKRKVRAMSSEAKASAYIIGSLPFVMTGLIYLVNPDYIIGLYLDPRGKIMIGFGLGMIAAGAGVMYRMVRFEI
jgi:tight adherence protein B